MMAAVQWLMVGSTFSSLEKLEAEVNAYQSEKFVQLVKRDTKTLEMANKRVPKRDEGANTALVYYSIHYICAFGGKVTKMKEPGRGEIKGESLLLQLHRQVLHRLKLLETLTFHFVSQQHSQTRLPSWNKDQAK